jgi:hypothetical protein
MLLFLPSIGFAQGLKLPVDAETQKVSFTHVQDVVGSKDELYIRAKIWFVNAFKDAQEVIQLDDKENGIIMGKGILNINYQVLGTTITDRINFTISIRVKDNKFKAEITDMKQISETAKTDTAIESYNEDKLNKNKIIQKVIASTIEQTEKTIASIKNTMASTNVSLKKDF